MGKALGFSDAHLSLVAMIWNLHTGFVSSKYHIVHNNKFDPIFSNGSTNKNFDTICNVLFENCQDGYTQEEFDDDDYLLYQPPPLDEVLHLLMKCGHQNQRVKTAVEL